MSMWSEKWITFCSISALVLLVLFGMMTHSYEGEAISGRVVDAETKMPLAGVVVAALWELRRDFIESRTIGYIWLDEAVTDSEGRYRLAAWGPSRVWTSYMGSHSPQLLFFKQDYQYKRLNNGVGKPTPRRKTWSSKWDGETLELEKFRGNIYEYKDHLGSLDIRINQLRDGNDCEWKKIPYFLVEIQKTEEHLKKEADAIRVKPLNAPVVTMDFVHYADRVWNQEKCGSAKEFFEGYLHEE